MRNAGWLTLLALCAGFSSCMKLPIDHGKNPLQVNMPGEEVTYAIIGDFGEDTPVEGEVANMVKSWNPNFIITTGDNNYTFGGANTIANNIGKYYCDYIYNPDAPEDQRCKGAAANDKVNRFFPSPGNHDHYSIPALKPYLAYFTLPGNELTYRFTWGPADFFCINSGKSGLINQNSDQGKWLKDELAKSTAPFKFVYFHHPPYSVSNHGSSTAMRWPFTEWKVDAVFNGHDHVFEKITPKNNSLPIYYVVGNSGKEHLYGCNGGSVDKEQFDVMCDDQRFGAMRVRVTAKQAILEYFTTADPKNPADTYIINKP